MSRIIKSTRKTTQKQQYNVISKGIINDKMDQITLTQIWKEHPTSDSDVSSSSNDISISRKDLNNNGLKNQITLTQIWKDDMKNEENEDNESITSDKSVLNRKSNNENVITPCLKEKRYNKSKSDSDDSLIDTDEEKYKTKSTYTAHKYEIDFTDVKMDDSDANNSGSYKSYRGSYESYRDLKQYPLTQLSPYSYSSMSDRTHTTNSNINTKNSNRKKTKDIDDDNNSEDKDIDTSENNSKDKHMDDSINNSDKLMGQSYTIDDKSYENNTIMYSDNSLSSLSTSNSTSISTSNATSVSTSNESYNEDIDVYHDFLLQEMGLNHEDIGHQEEVEYLLLVLQKFDAYMLKLG